MALSNKISQKIIDLTLNSWMKQKIEEFSNQKIEEDSYNMKDSKNKERGNNKCKKGHKWISKKDKKKS